MLVSIEQLDDTPTQKLGPLELSLLLLLVTVTYDVVWNTACPIL